MTPIRAVLETFEFLIKKTLIMLGIAELSVHWDMIQCHTFLEVGFQNGMMIETIPYFMQVCWLF